MNNYTNDNVKREKSRSLSVFDYFKILQLEAIVAELRGKIYPKSRDKNYWRKVYESKKNTVLIISEKNKVNGIPLPSIFTDSEMMEDYRSEIFGLGGYPKFIYKNEFDKNEQGYYDSLNYYYRGSKVICMYLNETRFGSVAQYTANSKTIDITLDGSGEKVKLEIENVTRLL